MPSSRAAIAATAGAAFLAVSVAKYDSRLRRSRTSTSVNAISCRIAYCTSAADSGTSGATKESASGPSAVVATSSASLP